MVLLGSGGHTAEMILLLAALVPPPSSTIECGPESRLPFRRTYVVTSGDALSATKAAAFERSLAGSRSRSRLASSADCEIRTVPRARRVGQSWLSTPWDCLRCLAGCVRAFARGGVPDVVLCNGPGSAVLVVAVALAGRFLGLAATRTVFVESFARTRSLSLSGRILYPLVDRFFVQWPAVRDKYPRAEYQGILV